MKIIFMGTSDFAVPILESLILSDIHNVVAVFTAPPKACGRGLKEQYSPVQKLAIAHNAKTFTPNSVNNPQITTLISSIEADIIIVASYGFLIPKSILYSKKYGSINIHPSDLPKYRGAAPLQRTIINGDTSTAVCIMQMDEGLDTGDIISREELSLHPGITLCELHDITAAIGAKLVISTLSSIDHITRIKQSSENASYAHKLTKEEGRINFHEDVCIIDRKIRGMNPWPGVYFQYQDKTIRILEAQIEYKLHGMQHDDFVPGQVIDNKLTIACGCGSLLIKKLQQSGKKAMLVPEFLRGLQIKPGTIL